MFEKSSEAVQLLLACSVRSASCQRCCRCRLLSQSARFLLTPSHSSPRSLWQWKRWHRAIKLNLAVWWGVWMHSYFGGRNRLWHFLGSWISWWQAVPANILATLFVFRRSVSLTTCISYALSSWCGVRYFHASLQRQKPGVKIPGYNLRARQSKMTSYRRRWMARRASSLR